MDALSQCFRFLSDEDCRCLLEGAEIRRRRADERFLAEGEQPQGLFLIVSGEARVERRVLNTEVEIARLCVGEIFGELSYVDGSPASASVVAHDATEALFIPRRRILALAEADAGFSARFYHSLADTVSRRLRNVTDGYFAPSFSVG